MSEPFKKDLESKEENNDVQKEPQEDSNVENFDKSEESRKNERPKTIEEWESLYEKERKDRQEANREAQALRKRANELELLEKKRRESEMTELEKHQERVKELELENERVKKSAQDTRILLAATRLGFNDPKDAIALIDRNEISEDEKNLDDLLKTILKSKPYLGKTDSKIPNRESSNPGGGIDQVFSMEQTEKSRRLFPTLKRLVNR
jgi:ATPase subunit of ABC transporter with duplicated ATPase domains